MHDVNAKKIEKDIPAMYLTLIKNDKPCDFI